MGPGASADTITQRTLKLPSHILAKIAKMME